MGPLFKTSALCLVALCGLQSATASKTLKFTVSDVGEDAYTSINLARRGDLTVRINEVSRDSSNEESLKSLLNQASQAVSGSACSSMEFNQNVKPMLRVEFAKTDSPNYREIVQSVLTKGLALSQMSTYPSQWNTVWAQDDGANFAKLLWSQSDKVGCAIAVCTEVESSPASEEQSSRAFLVCKMTPAPTTDQAPFTEQYYNALKQRKTALKDMKEDDVTSTGASSIAVPSVLLAGLVAIVATVAA